MNKMTDHQETPDIEVQGDQYEEEQAVLRDLANEDRLEAAIAQNELPPYCPKCDRPVEVNEIESGGNCARCHEPLEYDEYVGINSCDALRIIDGVA